MSQNCNQVVEKELAKHKIKENDDVVDEPLETSTDITQNTFKFLDDYLNLSKRPIINKKLLLKLKEKYKNDESFNNFINNVSSVKNTSQSNSNTTATTTLLNGTTETPKMFSLDNNNCKTSSSASLFEENKNDFLSNDDLDLPNNNPTSPISNSNSETVMNYEASNINLDESKTNNYNRNNSNETPSFNNESSSNLNF
jgi:hypothetical protein